MANILGVGIATLDIINTVNGYPPEDSEVRVQSQRICRGGNCTNTLVILSQLAHDCSWTGTLVDEPDVSYILSDLGQYNISTQYCELKSTGKIPTSYIILNSQNGSRSIVHYRDLEELTAATFTTIPLNDYDWVHFEGRNVPETLKMVNHLKQHHPEIPCSLEVEKYREDIEQLYEHFDIIIFSKAFCMTSGFDSAESFIKYILQQYNLKKVVVPWGSDGSYAADNNACIHYEPAINLEKVVDSLGAGDTFNAGLINSLLRQESLQQSLRSANRLAAFKCSVEGFNIKDYAR